MSVSLDWFSFLCSLTSSYIHPAVQRIPSDAHGETDSVSYLEIHAPSSREIVLYSFLRIRLPGAAPELHHGRGVSQIIRNPIGIDVPAGIPTSLDGDRRIDHFNHTAVSPSHEQIDQNAGHVLAVADSYDAFWENPPIAASEDPHIQTEGGVQNGSFDLKLSAAQNRNRDRSAER